MAGRIIGPFISRTLGKLKIRRINSKIDKIITIITKTKKGRNNLINNLIDCIDNGWMHGDYNIDYAIAYDRTRTHRSLEFETPIEHLLYKIRGVLTAKEIFYLWRKIKEAWVCKMEPSDKKTIEGYLKEDGKELFTTFTELIKKKDKDIIELVRLAGLMKDARAIETIVRTDNETPNTPGKDAYLREVCRYALANIYHSIPDEYNKYLNDCSNAAMIETLKAGISISKFHSEGWEYRIS